jgi:hypothetical protein
LRLGFNRISSIESGDFGGLTNLLDLELYHNWISSIESGAFSGFTSLRSLFLGGNIALTELNLDEAALSSLSEFGVGNEMVGANVNIASVSLKNAVLGWHSLVILLDGDGPDLMKPFVGIGELDGITKMDLSGIDFASITNLGPLYVMDDLTDLWFVNTQNVDATDLDVLLDNLETIEGTDTEGVLYMTQADYDAFNAAGGGLLADWNDEQGHHVEYLSIGDVNHDTEVNGLDVDPFVRLLVRSQFDVAADMNLDGQVNGLDVDPFVEAVVGGEAQSVSPFVTALLGSETQPVPEPSTGLLCLIALAVISGWRKQAAITKRQRSAILPAIRQHLVQHTGGAPPRPRQTPPVEDGHQHT